MQKKTLFWYGLLLFLLLLVLASYTIRQETPARPQNKLSLLFQSNVFCAAPCWQDLRPGVSTRTKVQTFVETLPKNSITNLKYFTFTQPSEEEYIWKDLNLGFWVKVELREGVVDFLSFNQIPNEAMGSQLLAVTPFFNPAEGIAATATPLSLNPDLKHFTIRDLFEVVGEPDEYSANISIGQHGGALFLLHLFYQEGVVITVDWGIAQKDMPDSTCTLSISADLPLQYIIFTRFTTLREASLADNPVTLMSADDEVLTWSGTQKILACVVGP